MKKTYAAKTFSKQRKWRERFTFKQLPAFSRSKYETNFSTNFQKNAWKSCLCDKYPHKRRKTSLNTYLSINPFFGYQKIYHNEKMVFWTQQNQVTNYCTPYYLAPYNKTKSKRATEYGLWFWMRLRPIEYKHFFKTHSNTIPNFESTTLIRHKLTSHNFDEIEDLEAWAEKYEDLQNKIWDKYEQLERYKTWEDIKHIGIQVYDKTIQLSATQNSSYTAIYFFQLIETLWEIQLQKVFMLYLIYEEFDSN